jgi:acid-sensing ion channel, other
MQSFKELLTPQGVCYKFNGVESYRPDHRPIGDDSKQWSIDEGYAAEAHIDTHPRRATRAGMKFGFSFLLRLTKKDQDIVCSVNSGFSVFSIKTASSELVYLFDFLFNQLLLRLPNEVPLLGVGRFDISMQQSVNIALMPKMMTTSEDVKKYPVEKRQCYFSNERYLQFFNDYTQGNCVLECEANVTIKYCGCLNFNFRSLWLGGCCCCWNNFSHLLSEQPGIPICGPAQMYCYENIITELAAEAIEGCNCRPGCTTIVFESVVTVGRLNMSTGMGKNDENSDELMFSILKKSSKSSTVFFQI